MIEYIDRKAALSLNLCVGINCQDCPFKMDSTHSASGCKVEDFMKAIPTEDVEEMRYGQWSVDKIYTYELSYGTTVYEPIYKCSVCGRLTESYLRYDEPIMPEDADFPHYYPHCGAKMDGEQDK